MKFSLIRFSWGLCFWFRGFVFCFLAFVFFFFVNIFFRTVLGLQEIEQITWRIPKCRHRASVTNILCQGGTFRYSRWTSTDTLGFHLGVADSVGSDKWAVTWSHLCSIMQCSCAARKPPGLRPLFPPHLHPSPGRPLVFVLKVMKPLSPQFHFFQNFVQSKSSSLCSVTSCTEQYVFKVLPCVFIAW